MPALSFAAEIVAPPEAIFAAIADLTGYGRWLEGSESFGGVTEVSPLPVALGTTYVDAGPSGVRRGEVVEFAPPFSIAFLQPMRLSGPLPGVIDIHLRCTLTAGERSTRVVRDLVIKPRGLLALATPLIVAKFKPENERVLAALKRHVEKS